MKGTFSLAGPVPPPLTVCFQGRAAQMAIDLTRDAKLEKRVELTNDDLAQHAPAEVALIRVRLRDRLEFEGSFGNLTADSLFLNHDETRIGWNLGSVERTTTAQSNPVSKFLLVLGVAVNLMFYYLVVGPGIDGN